MARGRKLEGNDHSYVLKDNEPFAFGRASTFFEAFDENEGLVCIKQFRSPPVLEKAFFRELKTQCLLKHENILPVLDFGQPRNRPPFLVLPLCECDLRSVLKSRSFLPLSDARPYLWAIASAIDAAHAHGFIHGDIKPENVLLRENRVFLSDFGMATYFSVTEDVRTGLSSSVGSDDPIGGTTAYLSPEQLDSLERSPYSDIYSFAWLVYELVTGRHPIDPTLPPFRRMKAKVDGQVSDPRSVNPLLSEAVSAAILHGLATKPTERPSHATTIVEGIFPEDDNLRDFFISYTPKDRSWAEWIGWELESAGYRVVLQQWDFRPGANFVLEMNNAAISAERTIAVLSQEYCAALYTQPEWAAAFVQDPTGLVGTLLPIRVSDFKPTGLLSSIVYIDLKGADEGTAKTRLLTGVNNRRAKPAARPNFPNLAETSPPQFPNP